MEAEEAKDADETRRFLQAWAWKREHRPDKVRFKLPYRHKLYSQVQGKMIGLQIKQQQFISEGFASTVWDSSIVMAKFFEKVQDTLFGKRCLDLSAGCGLVGIVLAKFGAHTTATDLRPNLALLKENCTLNAALELVTEEYQWGDPWEGMAGFDIISGCDLMYIDEAVDPLVQSLRILSGPETVVYMAYGRNRPAEAAFLRKARATFDISEVSSNELDYKYQCSDVTVLRLKKSQLGR